MNPSIIKICPKHGLVKFIRRHDKGYRCGKCASIAVSQRRRKLKQLAVELAGGCCIKCGYNKSIWALDFHHKDPTKKSFSLSVRGLTRSWEKTKEEIAKCVLLCANCHREEHDEQHNT